MEKDNKGTGRGVWVVARLATDQGDVLRVEDALADIIERSMHEKFVKGNEEALALELNKNIVLITKGQVR